MPTICVSHRDLNSLVGKNLTLSQLQDEAVLYAKGELEEQDGDQLKIDIKDTNRPDLWSVEGLAREIKMRYKTSFPEYKTKKSGIEVRVDPKMKNIRPYTVCAVVSNLNITTSVLEQMIQLQEKVSMTFGRNRKEIAMGAYDMSKIKSPIKFTSVAPSGIKFIPLEFSKEMTPKQILEQHPKGKEFGHLLKGLTAYPIFIDAAGEVLSIPPIINSEYTGKVTTNTKKVFIECSGFNLKFLQTALNVLVTALADRGGVIETVDVVYGNKKITTPNLTPKETSVNKENIIRLAGFSLTDVEITKLLEKSGYKIKQMGEEIKLMYPAYRQDIMHEMDVIEDVVISYGYNKIKPEEPLLVTKGRLHDREYFHNRITDIMIGSGLQEVMSYMLTNKEALFDKMNMPQANIVEISNPVSSNWSVFRTWMVPGLLDFLSQNMHREFPQKIFELGDCILIDPKKETKTSDVKKLAAIISDSGAGYEDITSILDFLLSNLGIEYKLDVTDHSSFIPGRTAKIIANGKEVGIVGEIHPQVLNNWKLEIPTSAFELDLSLL
ncbi:MAG: phenylalanine--tRNA ligase subunit beta [Candidatus Aenigmatarchaeota archaeon]